MDKILAIFTAAAAALSSFAAVQFDGVDDAFTIGDTLATVTSASTASISVWAKCTALPTSASQGRVFMTYRAPSSTAYAIGVLQSDGHWFFQYRATAQAAPTLDGGLAALNTWTHLALVRNGTSIVAYTNGVQCASASDAEAPDTSGGPPNAVMGRMNTSDNPFTGQIEDLAVYTRALPAAELLNLASCRQFYRVHTAFGYWPMNDGADGTSANGSSAIDRSGGGHNATGDHGGINAANLTWRASDFLSYP